MAPTLWGLRLSAPEPAAPALHASSALTSTRHPPSLPPRCSSADTQAPVPRVGVSGGTLHCPQAVEADKDTLTPASSALQRPAWSSAPWQGRSGTGHLRAPGRPHLAPLPDVSSEESGSSHFREGPASPCQPCLEETQAAPGLYQPQERSQE